jgi:adenylate cyclase class IV
MELELKGVVTDPAATRAALVAAGARPDFRGLMHDRRFDRDGHFTARDEVVRVRTHVLDTGDRDGILGWKGPTRLSPEGYKEREERELLVGEGDAERFLSAIGLECVHAIDRYIEMYALGQGHARLEWYPRMDVLIEVEGTPGAIERIIAITGIPRDSFTAESLTAFTARYDAAHPQAPSLVALDGWEGPAR